MKLPWRQDALPVGLEGIPGREGRDAGAQTCPSMRKVLERVFRRGRPSILDLGPFCGATAVYLADRGARVSVDEFRPPPPTPPKDPTRPDQVAPKVPLAIDQPDSAFDLVLAWEHCDFTPPDRISELGAELRRVLRDDGWLLLFSLNDPRLEAGQKQDVRRYRVVADDQLTLEACQEMARPRWVHPTRALERALSPMTIQGIHLQRNQIREFLALKPRDH